MIQLKTDSNYTVTYNNETISYSEKTIFNSGDYFEDTKQGEDDGNSINRTIKLIFGMYFNWSEEAISEEGSEEEYTYGSGDPYIHSLFGLYINYLMLLVIVVLSLQKKI